LAREGESAAAASADGAVVSAAASAASADGAAARAYTGLLVDWGGVMTTDLFASFRAFCEREGLSPEAMRDAFRANPEARDLLIALEEGRLEESEFEPQLAALLKVEPLNLIDRLFAGSSLDSLMVVAVRAAHDAGIHTGLVSNSWGVRRYPRPLLGELFDGIVISGELGIRKPAPRMYELGAERIGVEPAACVYVDDLPFNLKPAQELGMATIHHVQATETIAELERLLGVDLGKRVGPAR
jgi:epoxide hydrolase-like predicted phosphatase